MKKNRIVYLVWDDSPENVEEYAFRTIAECNAFLLGLSTAMDYTCGF